MVCHVVIVRLVAKLVDATQLSENLVVSRRDPVDLLDLLGFEALYETNFLIDIYLGVYLEHFFGCIKLLLKLPISVRV